MDTIEKAIPFGLIFEEAASQPQVPIVPIYDEKLGVSYVEDPNGRRIPYVELAGTLATETYTQIAKESVDEDEDNDQHKFVGTETETKIRHETTDADDQRVCLVVDGTQTVTAVEAESTDTDPGDDHARFSVSNCIRIATLATDTFTKEGGESTDKD